MERLREQDYQAVLRFLAEIYAPGEPDQFPDRLVHSLDALIPSEVATYDEMDTVQRTSSDWFSQAGVLTPDLMRDNWPTVMHEHPVLMLNQRAGDLGAHRISEFYSESMFHELALYREFYGKVGIEDGLCKGIRASGPIVIGCAFHRDRRSFNDRDSLVFDLIGPHITQAWQNDRLASQINAQLAMLDRAADAVEAGFIAITEGKADYLTERTRRLVERFFGRGSRDDHSLPEPLACWLNRQSTKFDSTEVPAPFAPLIIEGETSRLLVRCMRGEPGYLLLLQEERQSKSPFRLQGRGITPREIEVLQWVAKGKTNEEIGLVLTISTRTVQKHLEHIFTKLGVETRTAAASMLNGVQH